MYKNGSFYDRISQGTTIAGNTGFDTFGSKTIRLNAGEYIEIYAQGGANNGGYAGHTVTVTRIGG